MDTPQTSLEVYRSYCKALGAKPNSHVVKVLGDLIDSQLNAPGASHTLLTPLDFSPTFLGKKGHFPLLETLRVCYRNNIVKLCLSDTGMRDEACTSLCTMVSGYSEATSDSKHKASMIGGSLAVHPLGSHLPLIDFPHLEELDLRRNMLTMDSVPPLKGMTRARRRAQLSVSSAATPAKPFDLKLEGNLNIYGASEQEILKLSTMADVIADVIVAQGTVFETPTSSSGGSHNSPTAPAPFAHKNEGSSSVVVVSTAVKKHSEDFAARLWLTQRRLAQSVSLGRLQRRIRPSMGEGSAGGGVLGGASSPLGGWLCLGVYVSSHSTGFHDEMWLLRHIVFPRVNAQLKKHQVFLSLVDLHEDPMYTDARRQAALAGAGSGAGGSSAATSVYQHLESSIGSNKAGQSPQGQGKSNPSVSDSQKIRLAMSDGGDIVQSPETAKLTALRRLMLQSSCDIFLGLYQDGGIGARSGLGEAQAIDWNERESHVKTLQSTNTILSGGVGTSGIGRRGSTQKGSQVPSAATMSNSMVPTLGYFRKVHGLPKTLESQVVEPAANAVNTVLLGSEDGAVNPTGSVVAASALQKRQEMLEKKRRMFKNVKEGILDSCKADYDAHFSGVNSKGAVQFKLSSCGANAASGPSAQKQFVKTLCSDLCAVALQLNARRSAKLDDASGDVEHWAQSALANVPSSDSGPSAADNPQLGAFLHKQQNVGNLPEGLSTIEHKTVELVRALAQECAPRTQVEAAKEDAETNDNEEVKGQASGAVDAASTPRWQVLHGAAGSGKSYTLEKVRDLLVVKGGSRVVYHRVASGCATLPAVFRDLAATLLKQLTAVPAGAATVSRDSSVGEFGDMFQPLRAACNKCAEVHRGAKNVVFIVDDDQLLKGMTLGNLALQGLRAIGVDPLQVFVDSLSVNAQATLNIKFVFSTSDQGHLKRLSNAAAKKLSLVAVHQVPRWTEHEGAAFFTDHLFAQASDATKEGRLQAARHIVTQKEDGCLPLYLTLAAHEMAKYSSELTSYSMIADDLPGKLETMIQTIMTRGVPADLLPVFRAMALTPFAPSGALLQNAVLPSSYLDNHYSCLNRSPQDVHNAQQFSGEFNSLLGARWGRVRAVPPGALKAMMVFYLNFQHLLAANTAHCRDVLPLPPTATKAGGSHPNRNVNLLRSKWYLWSSTATECLAATYGQEAGTKKVKSGRKKRGISFDANNEASQRSGHEASFEVEAAQIINPWDAVISRWSYLRENPFSLSLLPFNKAALTRPGLYSVFNLLINGQEGALAEALQLAATADQQSGAETVRNQEFSFSGTSGGFGGWSDSDETSSTVTDNFLNSRNNKEVRQPKRYIQSQFPKADCTAAYSHCLAEHWELLVKYPTALYQILPDLLAQLSGDEANSVQLPTKHATSGNTNSGPSPSARASLIQRHYQDAQHNFPTSQIKVLHAAKATNIFNWPAYSVVEDGARVGTGRVSSPTARSPHPLSPTSSIRSPSSSIRSPTGGSVSWKRRHRIQPFGATEMWAASFLTVEGSLSAGGSPTGIRGDSSVIQPPERFVAANQHHSFGVISVISLIEEADAETDVLRLKAEGDPGAPASRKLVSVSRRTHSHAICAVAIAETKHTVRIIVSAFCDPELVVLSLHDDLNAKSDEVGSMLSIVTRVSLPDSKVPQRPMRALAIAATLPRGYLRKDESEKNDEGMYCPSFTVGADTNTFTWPATLHGRDLTYNNVSRSKEVTLLPSLLNGPTVLGYSMAGLKLFGVNSTGEVTVWATTESPVPGTVFATTTLPRSLHPSPTNKLQARFGDAEWIFFANPTKGLAAWHSAGLSSGKNSPTKHDADDSADVEGDDDLNWLVSLEADNQHSGKKFPVATGRKGMQCALSSNPQWQDRRPLEKKKSTSSEAVDDGKLETLLKGGASIEHLLSRFIVVETRPLGTTTGSRVPFLRSYGAWTRSETKMEKIDRLVKEDKEQNGEEVEAGGDSGKNHEWPSDLRQMNPTPVEVSCSNLPTTALKGGQDSWVLHPHLSVHVSNDQTLRVGDCRGLPTGEVSTLSSAWFGIYLRGPNGAVIVDDSEEEANPATFEDSHPAPLFRTIDDTGILVLDAKKHDSKNKSKKSTDPVVLVVVVDKQGVFHLLEHKPEENRFPVPTLSQC